MEEHFLLRKTSENLKYVMMLKRTAVIHVVENSRVEEAEMEEKNEEMNRPDSGHFVSVVTVLCLDNDPRDFGLKVAFFLTVATLLIQLSDRK